MNLSPADLARILNQPGYSVVEGSLWQPEAVAQNASEAAYNARRDVLAHPRASTHVPWQSERHFQAAVIAECDRRAVLEPEYGLVCHIPNENSHRQPGVRAGIPDLFLPCANKSGGYIGLWIELKCKDNKPSRSQLDMIHRLRMQGYRCEIVWDSLDEVMSVIEGYLRGDA